MKRTQRTAARWCLGWFLAAVAVLTLQLAADRTANLASTFEPPTAVR